MASCGEALQAPWGRDGSSRLKYSEGFKKRMVSRLTGTGATSATSLSREVGVSQNTLSRWLREASSIEAMSKKKNTPTPQSPRDWPFEKKLRVVYEALSLSESELGEFLRREGLHEVQLREMQKAVEEALGRKKKASKKDKSQAKMIKKLEKELVRKEKALAEVTALLVLKKKLDAYFLGDEDGDTRKKNGK